MGACAYTSFSRQSASRSAKRQPLIRVVGHCEARQAFGAASIASREKTVEVTETRDTPGVRAKQRVLSS